MFPNLLHPLVQYLYETLKNVFTIENSGDQDLTLLSNVKLTCLFRISLSVHVVGSKNSLSLQEGSLFILQVPDRDFLCHLGSGFLSFTLLKVIFKVSDSRCVL